MKVSMRCKLLISLVFVAGLAWGQSSWLRTTHRGIAVADAENASLLNMAALGVGNATGIGFSGYWIDRQLEINESYLALGPFAYNFRGLNEDFIRDHEIGFGYRIYRGVYAGTSFRWNSEGNFGWNIHTLFRPTGWLSFAINANSLVSKLPPSIELGAGLRPLFFSDYWATRLTLFYEGAASFNGASYRNNAVGLQSSPIDGLHIYGHWDFRSENFIVGVKLSWNHFLVGAGMPVAGDRPWKNFTTEVAVTYKELRSLPLQQKPKLIIYDLAQVITDTPNSFSISANPFRLEKTQSIYDFLVHMDELASMRDVDAVLFRNQEFRTSFSNLYEIETAIKRIKESGKKIYFYSESYNPLQYALAAGVADEIIVYTHGSLSVQGFAQTKLYFKDLLAKYGVSFYNFQSHEHKTAFDSFSEPSMTDAEREALEHVYGALQDEMDRMIKEGRGDRLNEELKTIYSKGFWMSSKRAQQAGFVDSRMYSYELDKMIEDEFSPVLASAEKRLAYDWQPIASPIVAIIYANGYIHRGEGRRGRSIGAKSLVDAIRTARENPLVRAIVLRVNSGGGSALASNLIANEIELCVNGEKPKPVVVSMAGVAASGGYLISSPATKILATPASISGSIGVISIMPNLSGLLERFEVDADTVTTAKSADLPNIFRPLSEEELAHISDLVIEEYENLVSTVARGRNSSRDAIEESARGRIWSGGQARDRGLIDELGGLSEAVEAAKKLADIKGDAHIIEVNPGLTHMQDFLWGAFGIQEKPLLSTLPQEMVDIIEFYEILAKFEGENALYLMPYVQQP